MTGAAAGNLGDAATGSGRRAPRRHPALASIEAALQPGEQVEATAWCSAGAGAGIAALTDRRILFAPGRGPARSIPYSRVRSVHHQHGVGLLRRTRVSLSDGRPLHLVTGSAADLCGIVRRHTGAA